MARFGFTDERNRGIDEGVARIGVNAQQQREMIDQLLRSLGSLNAQSLNRAADVAGAYELPLATRLAQMRNIAQSTAEAGQGGIFNIQQLAQRQNSDAYRFLAGLTEGQRQFDLNRQDERRRDWFKLIGQAAQSAGYAYGNRGNSGGGGG